MSILINLGNVKSESGLYRIVSCNFKALAEESGEETILKR